MKNLTSVFFLIVMCVLVSPVFALEATVTPVQTAMPVETAAPVQTAVAAPALVPGDDLRLSFLAGPGSSVMGLPVPAFLDANGAIQNEFNIRSFDFMLQAGIEKIVGNLTQAKKPIRWGLRGKLGLAYTYWQTQQGGGEPGNYFADMGISGSGVKLHSGDMINISGFWWAVSPALTAHMPLNSNFELAAALGFSLYGYAGMSILSPSENYSTSIADSAHVWHSVFLQKYLSSVSVGLDWELKAAYRPKGAFERYIIEGGMTGPAWNFCAGIEYPLGEEVAAPSEDTAVQTAAEESETQAAEEIPANASLTPEKTAQLAAPTPTETQAAGARTGTRFSVGYKYVSMDALNNAFKALANRQKLILGYNGVSYAPLNHAVALALEMGYKFDAFYFGPQAGYLFCVPGKQTYEKMSGALSESISNEIGASLLQVSVGGGYETALSRFFSDLELPLLVNVSLYGGYAWGTVSQTITDSNNQYVGDYTANEYYVGSAPVFDLGLGLKYGIPKAGGVTWEMNLGYKYCLIPKVATDKDYTVVSSRNFYVTRPKNTVLKSGTSALAADFRGFQISAGIRRMF